MGASTDRPDPNPHPSQSADRPDSSRPAGGKPTYRWLVVILIMLPIVGGIWYTIVLNWNVEGRKLDEERLVRDSERVRELIQLNAARNGGLHLIPLAADGRIDLFGPIRDASTEEAVQLIDLLRSERFNLSPTIGQIREGDYRLYVYMRHKGKIPKDKVVPILWDPEPDRRNERLVALSDGSVHFEKEAEIDAKLRAAGQK